MSAVNLKTFSSEEISRFIDSFDTVLTDCDGVLWVGMVPLPHSAEVINSLQQLGKKVFYVTNNCTKSREEFVEKCEKLSFQAREDDILCTSNLAATYLKSLSFDRKVYVIGKAGIAKELDKVGISHYGTATGDNSVEVNINSTSLEKDPDVGAVIVGYDDHFDYTKLTKASNYLADHEVHFIGTSSDEKLPSSKSVLIPGTGALIRSIEACVNRKATILGKPEAYIADVIKSKFNVDPSRTLMIGDNVRTDILLGRRCGFKTLLALTGATPIEDVETLKGSSLKEDLDMVPDYYVDALGDLYPHLEKYTAGL